MQKGNAHQELPHDAVITMPEGLIGLPAMRRWVLKEPDQPMPLKWLESVDRPGFRLPVIDPWYYHDGIVFDLSDHEEELLGRPSADQVVVLIVSRVYPGGEKITGNLAAPIVLHPEKRLGVQCICDERKYSLHREIDYVRFGSDVRSLQELQVDRLHLRPRQWGKPTHATERPRQTTCPGRFLIGVAQQG